MEEGGEKECGRGGVSRSHTFCPLIKGRSKNTSSHLLTQAAVIVSGLAVEPWYMEHEEAILHLYNYCTDLVKLVQNDL